MSHLVFWAASFLLLSWPLRVVIEYKTAHLYYHVHKLFGTNYVVDARALRGTLSRGSTLTSAEMEMNIRNNNFMVPSYSDALLMNGGGRRASLVSGVWTGGRRVVSGVWTGGRRASLVSGVWTGGRGVGGGGPPLCQVCGQVGGGLCQVCGQVGSGPPLCQVCGQVGSGSLLCQVCGQVGSGPPLCQVCGQVGGGLPCVRCVDRWAAGLPCVRCEGRWVGASLVSGVWTGGRRAYLVSGV